MRVLLLTQLFQPEPNHLKGIQFVKELQMRGYGVQVLTGFPNYPGGSIYPGYRIRLFQREVIDGVDIIRVIHFPSHDTSGIKRFLNYVSFGIAACCLGLWLIQRADIIHVYQGPATLMIPAVLFKVIFKSRIVLDIQDLWPDSVISSGMLKIPGGKVILKNICRLTYRISDTIMVQSQGYKSRLITEGIPEQKIHIIFNWCDESSIKELHRNEDVGIKYGLKGKFNIIFAGTMGKVQALDSVLESALLLKNEHPSLQFVFVGGGVDVPRLKKIAETFDLHNVHFIPRQAASEISHVLAYADVLLIHLRDTSLGRIGIPQKTQAYLAAGKPILMAVEGEAADIVTRSHSGFVCKPDDALSITKAIIQLYRLSEEKRKEYGSNGLQYYKQHMSFDIGIQKIMDLYKSLVV